jgi:2-polyprenyl-3-methyl-5-hydroxy-6-metoxy-1,4-benzoquinol methylase
MAEALIHRLCPICSDPASTPFLAKGSLQLVQCPACAMVYANPVTNDFATGTFYNERGDSFYLSPAKLESDYAPVRFERELRIFRRYCSSGRVLDVGCSTGAFLYQLTHRFPGAYAVTGMDVTGAALDHAESRGIEVLRGDFLIHDFETRQFDAICFWAVLEHLINPRAFVERAVERLAPGGHLFILVPNLESLAVRLLGARYRYIMPDHVNYFSKRTLLKLLGSAGAVEVVASATTHFNPMVIWKDRRASVDRVPDQERARLLQKTTAWKQSPFLKPVLWAYRGAEASLRSLGLADNLVVAARKTA